MFQNTMMIYVVINSIMSCLMAVTTYLLRKNYPSSIKGMQEWSYFPLIALVASVLYGTQGWIHHYISMALPNVLMIMVCMVHSMGTHKFYGKQIKTTQIWVFIAISTLFFIFTSGKPEYYNHRLMFVSGTFLLVLLGEAHLLWGHKHGSLAAKLMLATIFMFCAVMLLRFVTASTQLGPSGIYTYSLIHAIYLGAFSFGILFLSMSGILLASEKVHDEMQHLLRHDALTGAMSRNAILDLVSHEFSRVKRGSSSLSILMMDLDRFKQVNDTYGHQVGDQVLTNLVESVQSTIRQPAQIGRYGGDEFLVALPDTNLEQATLVAKRITDVNRNSNASPKVTLSIGLATQDNAKDTDMNHLIMRADNALYLAKNSGKDKVGAHS